MRIRMKCKNCEHIYLVDLSGSEYFLPAKCPSCGYFYQNDAALLRWLEEMKAALEQDKKT